jgi:hypothetical protein
MGSLATHIINWISRPSTAAGDPDTSQAPTGRAQSLASRARASAKIARLALESDDPAMPAYAVASELFRQAVFWGLCASSADRTAGESTAPQDIWDDIDDTALRSAASDAERPQKLRCHLRNGSFVYFEELDRAEQQTACVELRELARLYLRRLEGREGRARRSRRQFAVGFGTLVVALLVASWVRVAWRAHREARDDLAIGRPWRTSSLFSGCASPKQDCATNTGYFFHTETTDNHPWIEFDLGRARRVSSVVVTNRVDCCRDRAAPLVVEVATRKGDFRSVARTDAEFVIWRAQFDSVDAEWVRLRNPDHGMLHLYRVRILP